MEHSIDSNNFENIKMLLEDILELKQDIADEASFFFEVSKKLGQVLNVEYCAIGRRSNNHLSDYPPYVYLGSKSIEALENVRNCEFEGSLVGWALNDMIIENNTNQKVLSFKLITEEEILNNNIPQNKNNSQKYNTSILHSGRQKEVLVVGLYKKNQGIIKNIGYIHLINKLANNDNSLQAMNENSKTNLTNFNENDFNMILSTTSLIQTLLVNYDKENELKKQNDDSKLINDLMENDNIDESFNTFYNHLIRVFNCKVSAFWYPIWDGFENISKLSTEKEEGSLKILLRESFSPEKNHTAKFARKQVSYEEHEIFLGEIFHGFKKISPNTIIKKPIHQIPFEKLWNEIELGISNIVITPIYRTNHEDIIGNEPKYSIEKFEHIIGIIYLGYEENQNIKPEDEERLKSLAKNFGIMIENKIFKRRFDQIRTLKSKLIELSVNDPKEFYSKVVSIVKEMMICKICTIMILDSSSDELILKASSAKKVNIKDNYRLITKKIWDLIDTPIYEVTKKESLTVRVFLNEQTYLSFDENNFRKTTKTFTEEAEADNYTHKSVLTAPIYNDVREVIGLIKCVNKSENQVIFQSFVQDDKDFLSLITSIISKFIEYFRFNQDKASSATMFIHELALPMQAIMVSRATIAKLLSIEAPKIKNTIYFQKVKKALDRQESDLEQLQILTSIFRTSYGGESDNQKTTKTMIYPKSDVEKIVESLRIEALTNKNLGIELSIEKMETMFVDIGQFKQVIYNLLKNAIRYSNENSNDIEIVYERLTLDLYKKGDFKEYDAITFNNWGIGIEESEKEKIFKLGFRGKKAKIKQPGSGVGLYVVEQIMKAHKGRVEIRNIHKPTIITIYFPKL
jgi:signal transduction histidine kinase